MNRRLITILVLFCVANSVYAASPAVVITYPPPGTARAGEVFSVTVNGKAIFVEENRWISYAHFAFAGKIDVKVRVKDTVHSYTLSPASYGIESAASGSEISFSLSVPRKLVLHNINDWNKDRIREPRLFIFADPLEDNAPEPNGPGIINAVERGIGGDGKTDQTSAIQALIDETSTAKGTLYFPPGTYRITSLRMKDDVTMYLAGGARLQVSNDAPAGNGIIMLENVRNVKLCGRGSIDGNGVYLRYDPNGPKKSYSIVRSLMADNVVVEELILQNPSMFNMFIRQSENWYVYNVKFIDYMNEDLGRYAGIDGIDPDQSRNIVADNVFICSGDDCTSVKGAISPRWPQMGNIVFRNSVMLNHGSGIAMGFSDIRNVVISDVTYENIDVVGSLLGMGQGYVYEDGNSQEIKNVYYKNIRVGPIRAALLLSRATAGPIRNIYYHNISCENWGPNEKQGQWGNQITGTDPNRVAENIVLDNFRAAGRLVTDSSDFAVNEYVKNLQFRQTPSQIVTIKAAPMYAVESPSSQAVFTVTREGPNEKPLTVSYTIRGTAANGKDYSAIADSVTIPAGAGSAAVVISPKADDLQEGIETVFLSLLNQPHSLDWMLGPDYQAVVVICDTP